MNCSLYRYKMSIFVSCHLFCLEICFVRHKHGYIPFSLVAICLEYRLLPLTLSLCFPLELWWVFSRQDIVGSYFLIPPAPLCLSSGELSPLTFSAIIAVWGLTTAILSFVFRLLCVPHYFFSFVSLSILLIWFSVFFSYCFHFYVWYLSSGFLSCGYH